MSRLLERRWDASWRPEDRGTVLVIAIVGALVVEYVFWRVSARARPACRARRRTGGDRRASCCSRVIGLLANDSGLAVPGVMLAVAVPVAVLRADAWLDGTQ